MPTVLKQYGVKVWNLKTERARVPKGAVYVGRPSTFGNPFLIGRGGRKACLDKYREYLTKNTKIAELALRHLKGKDLVCWCAPESCHAEVLAEVANG